MKPTTAQQISERRLTAQGYIFKVWAFDGIMFFVRQATPEHVESRQILPDGVIV